MIPRVLHAARGAVFPVLLAAGLAWLGFVTWVLGGLLVQMVVTR